MRIVNSDQVIFSRRRVCCPSDEGCQYTLSELSSLQDKLTFDKSYRKTQLLASLAYEGSIAPCVLHIRAQTTAAHIDRRLHSSSVHHQAEAFDNPISSQFYRPQRSQGQADGIYSSLAQVPRSGPRVP